jgi:hypothetical protein
MLKIKRFEKKSQFLFSSENCIGGLMIGVFASSVVDLGFKPLSDQTKD